MQNIYNSDRPSDIFSKILINIVVFMLLFSPRFGSIDTSIIVALGVGFLFVLFCLYKRIFYISLREVLFTYLIVYAFILVAFTDDTSNFLDRGYYLFRILRSFGVYLSLLACVVYFRSSAQDLIKAFMNAMYAHLVFVYFQQFNIFGLSSFFNSLNSFKDESINFDNYVGVLGLMTGHDGAGLLLSCLSALILVYYKKTIPKIIMSILILIGVVITSRTGMMTWAIVNISYIIYMVVTRRLKLRYLYVLIIASYLVSMYVPTLLEKYQQVPVISRAFEMYYMYQNSQSLETQSTLDLLQNHYKIPDDPEVFLIGNPIRNSDVGYIQILYNFGVFNFVIILALTIFWFRSFQDSKHRLAAFLITIAIIVGCFKGPYFFSRGAFDLIILYMVIEKLNRKPKEITNVKQESLKRLLTNIEGV